ncbi:MAG: hypothetical protein Q9216_006456 [Gyalolechia sp. 2 TL-2023]
MRTSISILFFLAAISPALTLPSQHLRRQAASTCDQYTPITSGSYEVQNNAWGAVPGGTSCVSLGSSSGSNSSVQTVSSGSDSVAWSTEFNWSGDPGAIKSYANAQAKDKTPCKPLNQYKTMPSSWSWSWSSSSSIPPTGNIAYDAFLNPTCNTPGDPHAYEVMIWLAQLGGLDPISDGGGDPKPGIQLAGASWKLYTGTNTQTGTMVHSFVVADVGSPIDDFSGDLMDFLNYLAQNEGVDGGLMVTSVQAGTEISLGQGKVETGRFSIAST